MFIFAKSLKTNHSGFTLVEVLVVIAIIGILSSVAVTSLTSSREMAQKAQATSQLGNIKKAMEIMYLDTGMYPNNLPYLCEPLDEISSTNEYTLSDPNSGLVTNGRGWTKWDGPYISEIPRDPWGNEYYFDDDYRCLPTTDGCNGLDDSSEGLVSSVFVSCGENAVVSGGSCSYDTDNIVKLLCRR